MNNDTPRTKTDPEIFCRACGSRLVNDRDWVPVTYSMIDGSPDSFAREWICPKHPGRRFLSRWWIELTHLPRLDAVVVFNEHVHMIETKYADPSREPSLEPLIWS